MNTIAAVGQFCATSIIHSNRLACRNLILQAARLGAKMIFLPEASDFISFTKQETLQLTTSIEKSEFVLSLKEAAQQANIWVSVGVHELVSSTNNKIYNSHLVIDNRGELITVYRKIHLFNVDIENGPRLMESDSTMEGQELGHPILTPIGKLGLQTCYDVRFPEASIALRKRGAEILAFPSAFTIKTGMAHWETLLRARAIETQTYVIAAAQIGQHNEKRASYGHAMIVDPWGKVLAECPENTQPSIAIANIDLDYMKKIRAEMPVMTHRRTDLYPSIE
ncbi:carbon-nitrogen hydrolase [Cokeromyces recurvatus]|uniref:carbon-nitrogen hydrolase n=1 Tax=Cokeromyces recurvatus TaxID=90255 RepID=UPI0022205E5C|nr:carbon-nitrogen hydrolase [Cokeromyces recurvatus]KAI7905065.1 carbon-nitrogen hydrolase [Cokeromyces recurvatus]